MKRFSRIVLLPLAAAGLLFVSVAPVSADDPYAANLAAAQATQTSTHATLLASYKSFDAAFVALQDVKDQVRSDIAAAPLANKAKVYADGLVTISASKADFIKAQSDVVTAISAAHDARYAVANLIHVHDGYTKA